MRELLSHAEPDDAQEHLLVAEQGALGVVVGVPGQRLLGQGPLMAAAVPAAAVAAAAAPGVRGQPRDGFGRPCPGVSPHEAEHHVDEVARGQNHLRVLVLFIEQMGVMMVSGRFEIEEG